MQHWFDPIAIGIVFLGTLAATVLRCGLVDARQAARQQASVDAVEDQAEQQQ